MQDDIRYIIAGALLTLVGLFFIFNKQIERFEFLYLFDGTWKESPRWRKWKRIILGIIALTLGIAAFYQSIRFT